MTRINAFWLSFLTLILSAGVSRDVRGAELGTGRSSSIKVRAGMPYGTIVYCTYFLAKEMGFYRDEGLDVEIIHVASVSGLQALLSGDLQFVGAGTTPINAALRGAKLKTVFVAVDKPEFDLYVNPNIRSFKDLRGKSIMVSGIGALTERLLKELLKMNGVDPSDVIIRALGNAELRSQALAQGAVDGSLLAPPLNFKAEAEGFRKLAFLGDFLQATSASITVTDQFRQSAPEIIGRFVKASLRGIHFYKESHDATLRFIMRFIRTQDKDLAQKSYAFHLASLTKDGTISEDLMRKTIEDSKAAMKAIKELPISDVFDFNFVRRAVEELGKRAK